MTTKERIIDEALTLFSKRGYEGVSVKEIAAAVGIKDSSLYKHFRSKQDIFQGILQTCTEKMGELSAKLELPEEEEEKLKARYGHMTVEDLKKISREAFLFYLKDPFVSRFRRLLNREQGKHTQVSQLYRQIFMEDSITYQTKVFGALVKMGVFGKGNPETMAIHFYSVIFFLLCKYDECPEQEEEALRLLDNHVEEFNKIYSK